MFYNRLEQNKSLKIMILIPKLYRMVLKEHESISCSVVSESATPWTIAYQAPLSMEFSRQETYWSG